MIQFEWKHVGRELPMKDGFYAVTNNPMHDVEGICWYDGYGFLYESIYRNPTYWKEIERKQKRYGKLNDPI